MTRVIAFNVCLLGCLIYALWRGGGPEKIAMSSQAAAAAFTIFAIRSLPHSADFAGLAHMLVLVDALLLAVLTAVALRANRWWTIVLAGLQLSTVVVHLSKALYPALPAASYGIFAQFWAWPMLMTTALGIRGHWRRRTRMGAEQDWKPLWPHSVPVASTT